VAAGNRVHFIAGSRKANRSELIWQCLSLKSLALTGGHEIWQDVTMKPRRPAVKDSTQNLRSEGAKRKSAQVAARAARKAEAKRRKLEAGTAAENVNQDAG
jgi:hypothetical protein